MKRILIAAGALTLLAPCLVQAQPVQDENPPPRHHGKPPQGPVESSAPPEAPTPRTGEPVNPRSGSTAQSSSTIRPLQGAARVAPGMNSSASLFSYRGASHPVLRAPAFSYPLGWGYRHWVVGQSLPLLFLAGPYWFDDFALVDIPPPPPGHHWVRYGPDLLLVNIRTGRITDVIYGVFA